MSNLKKFQAAEGKMLPIFYCGSIIRIDDKEPKELDVDLLGYEPKIHLEKALKQKDISEIGEEE